MCARAVKEQGGNALNRISMDRALDRIAGQDLTPGGANIRGNPSLDSRVIISARDRIRRARKKRFEYEF